MATTAETPPLEVHQLSERAQVYIRHLLDARETPIGISRTVYNHTREHISEAAVERYAEEYARTVRAVKDARVRTEHLVGEIIHQGGEVSEMLRAAFNESYARAREAGALAKMSPLLFEAAERHRIDLDLRKKQVSLAERRVKVFEDRLHLDRKRAQAAIARLDRKARRGDSVTTKEVERIRELYGIYDSTDRNAPSEERGVRQLEKAAASSRR